MPGEMTRLFEGLKFQSYFLPMKIEVGGSITEWPVTKPIMTVMEPPSKPKRTGFREFPGW